jgi:hypothetical protein
METIKVWFILLFNLESFRSVLRYDVNEIFNWGTLLVHMSYIGTNDQVVDVLLRKVLTVDDSSIFNACLEFWDNQWKWGAVFWDFPLIIFFPQCVGVLLLIVGIVQIIQMIQWKLLYLSNLNCSFPTNQLLSFSS